jgi:hypothetical protein
MFGKKGYPNNHFCVKNGYNTKRFFVIVCPSESIFPLLVDKGDAHFVIVKK